jgi:transposase-like protein
LIGSIHSKPKGDFRNDPIQKNFYLAKKATIVLRHLIDKTPVSDLCDEFGLHPFQTYTWQKRLTDNAALVFQTPRQSTKHEDTKDRKSLL